MEEKKERGERFNSGKIRYDLLEPYAVEQLAKVFTFGSKKYADHNWLKGLPWMEVVASLKRHLAAFEQGEDLDKETELFHMAHVAWNAMAIVSFYKHRPEFDNRRHAYLQHPKIGLDIDEVICDWVPTWCKKFGYSEPDAWNFMYQGKEHFDSFNPEELAEFYLNIPAKIKPSEIPFEPHCYITSRSVPIEITMEWIQKNGFPSVPVYSVPFGESKIEVAKKSGIDIFVDDRFENFVELNNAGICTYLLDAPHNRRYDVGYKRIYSLKELL